MVPPKPARNTHVHLPESLQPSPEFPHSPHQEFLLGSHSYRGGENLLPEERLIFPYPSCWKEFYHSPWKQPAIKLKVHKKWKVKPLGLQWHLTFIVHFYLFMPPAWHIACRICRNNLLEETRGGGFLQQATRKNSKCLLLPGLIGAAFTCKCGCWALLGNVWMQRFSSQFWGWFQV